jgi:polyisoprenoid-binding protein YceI
MPASDTAVVTVPVAGTYRLDPEQCRVRYTGRHLFGLGVVHATFAVTAGEVRVADPATDSRVEVSVDAASFQSNSPRRDDHVRSPRLLDASSYPEITFTSQEVRASDGRWVVRGQVTAHGQAVPVDLLVDHVRPEGDGFRARGRVERLDRHAFGVRGSKGLVGRYLDLELDVLATRV